MNSVKSDLKELSNDIAADYQSKSVNELWNSFKSCLKNSIDRNVPQKKIGNRRDVPWMTREIKRKINRKRSIYRKYKRNNSSSDKKRFEDLRREIKNDLKAEHNTYIGSLFERKEQENTTNKFSVSKKFWSYIKSRRKDNVSISMLRDGDNETNNPEDMANILNRQYESMFTEDSDTIPCKGNSEIPDMPHINFSAKGIEAQLRKLDHKKAPGPDQIPARILKEAAPEIAPTLRLIFKKSYETGTLPDDWKTANVSAIYKKGDKKDPANYRPVSLTSICCKVMEHILCSNISKHLDKHTILSDNQHGFRAKRSCETQLVQTIEDLSKSINDKQQIDMAILDFSKAFDTVSHSKLLYKLNHYGIRNNTLNWIESWITNRTQQVVLNGATSNQVQVKSGVPQGTVMGSLMFLLFINDIAERTQSQVRLFADDCLVYRNINTNSDSLVFQRDLDLLCEWASQWQMRFNEKKCYILHITNRRKKREHTYSMNGIDLDTRSHNPYLGVELQDDLKWTKHIEQATTKANRNLGFLRRNLRKCPETVKEQAYCALVRPHLEYAAAAWDPYLKKDIGRLEAVQRRAARFVKDEYSRTPGTVTSIYRDLNWDTLEKRRKILRLTLLHKVLHGGVYIALPSYIHTKTRYTRSSLRSRLTSISTSCNAYKFSFVPRTIQEWNNLPAHVTSLADSQQFKTQISQIM